MWLEVRWRRAGGRGRGATSSTRSIGCCREAFPIEPGLPLPVARLGRGRRVRAGIDDPMARQVVGAARCARRTPASPIGYRRDAGHDHPRGLGLEVARASFAERRTAEEWWGGGAGRAITLAAVQTGTDSGAMSAQAFVDQFAGDLGPDALDHHGDGVVWAGRGCRPTPSSGRRDRRARRLLGGRRARAPRSASSSTTRPTGSGRSTSGGRSPRAELGSALAGGLAVEDALDLVEAGDEGVDVARASSRR